jgi:glycosyltransferase involved in cell wall biosynthesis
MSLKQKPNVTVAVMSYNNARFVGQTVKSILSQEGVSFELIVFDDRSTDDSVAVLEEFLSDPRFRLEQNVSNLGATGNFNRCVEFGEGRYVVVLGSDDVMYPGHLESLYSALELYPDVALAYTQCNWIDEHGNFLRHADHPGHRPFSYFGHRDEVVDLLSYDNYITPSAVMFRRDVFDKIRLHDGSVLMPDMLAGDWELFIRIARNAPNFIFLRQATIGYRIHPGQVSSKFYKSEKPLAEHIFILTQNLDDPSLCFRIRKSAERIWECYSRRLSSYPGDIQKKYLEQTQSLKDKLFLPSTGLSPMPKNMPNHEEGEPVPNDSPLVSVIVPTHNRPVLLLRAVQSIKQQGYQHIEIVIVNDAGVDIGSLVNWLATDANIVYVRHGQNRKLSAARNTGLRVARGEIITYLDDDDVFLSDHVQTIVQCLTEGRPFAYTEAAYVLEDLGAGQMKEIERRPPGGDMSFSKERLHVCNYIPVNTWGHWKYILDEVGYFDEQLDNHEDWDFLLRCVQRFELTHVPVVSVEVHQRLQADNMLRRERAKFHDTFRLLYSRYGDLGSESVTREREKMLASLLETPAGKQEADAKPNTEEAYLIWLQKRQFDTRMAACYEARVQAWRAPYVFHVVVLLVGDEGEALSRTIKSLAEQYYYNVVISVVTPFEAPAGFQGERLRWLQVGEGEIVAGVNAAVERVAADWVTVVNAGDTFPSHVFLLLGEHINSHPDWRLTYADEDSITPSGFDSPYFKPDINPDMLRAFPYVGNALFARRDAFLELGGWAGDLAGAEGYDLLLKALERYGAQGIGHVADVLYHRQPGTGYAERLPSKAIAANTLEAVKRHLARQGVDATVEEGMLPGSHRVRYRHAATPRVSIIIPTKDELPMLQRCIESLLEKTRYPNYEILIVDNDSQTAEALAYLEGLQALGSERVRVLRYEKPFNFSAMNNLAAKEARGEYLLLLNNDTAVLEPDWLDEMMSHAQRPEVGVVGARLLFPNRLIQHAGVVLGMGLYAVADHPFIGFPAEDPGYWGRLELTQNYSAVTAACMVVRKALYDELGGLEEKDFKVLYNDVDFCLKVREKGYLAVWTPHATLLHEGTASQRKGLEARPDEAKLERIGAEQGAMWKRWLPQLANDPAFNPNLSLRARAMVLEANTALCWDPLPWRPLPYVLVHPADNMGCGKYRIADPVRALSEAGVIQGAESFTLFSPPEIERIRPVSVVLQRQVTAGQVLEIEKLKKYHPEILRVYELDDLITRLTVKNPHRENMPKDVYKMLRKGVALCDRFIVSTARLAEGYKGLHADIRVMPNTLRKSEWGNFKPLRRQGKKARVGWAGGLSHVGDLELIADVVAELADKVDWVFLGLCPDTLKKYVKEHHPGVETPLYPAKLAALNLDLAIAPLEINEFNECKSHLKLLEYGILGYPVVCTDILPYQGDYPVKRVPNRHKAWVDAILERVNDLDAAAREGDALREYVLGHWMIEDHLAEWKKAWLP